MELDFILYLKHYAISLEAFLRADQEEFIIDTFYKKQKMMQISKEKIQTELKIIKSITQSYEKYQRNNK
jgi:hypothetical protein